MTKQQLIQKVKKQIDLRREQAQSLAETNYQQALKNPAFHANDVNLRTVNLKIARLEFEEKDTSTESELLKVLTKEREMLLKNLKLKQTDLEPQYTCTKCNDTGIINNTTYCDCYNKLLEESLRQDCCSNVDPSHTFEKSKQTDEQTKKVYDTLQKWCDKYPNKIKNITLCGNTGTGKTYLTESIANALIKKGVVVQFTTAFNLNYILLNYHTSFNENKSHLIDTFLTCDVLIIDDIGTEPINRNVTLEYLFLILNERQLNGKTTIITTNLTLDGIINRYGERIFSRINNKQLSLTIQLEDKDMRLKK